MEKGNWNALESDRTYKSHGGDPALLSPKVLARTEIPGLHRTRNGYYAQKTTIGKIYFRPLWLNDGTECSRSYLPLQTVHTGFRKMSRDLESPSGQVARGSMDRALRATRLLPGPQLRILERRTKARSSVG